jgi:hypothetical protein
MNSSQNESVMNAIIEGTHDFEQEQVRQSVTIPRNPRESAL